MFYHLDFDTHADAINFAQKHITMKHPMDKPWMHKWGCDWGMPFD